MVRSVALGILVGVVIAGGAVSVQAQGPWTAPEGEAGRKNPVSAGASAIAQGKKGAQMNCVTCHGAGGKGDGAAAAALSPKPADWTSRTVQDESDGTLFWKISNGRGPMPAWKAMIAENDRWALVHYIRSLKGK